MEKPKPPLRCSFCGKSANVLRTLIQGPYACICDECVGLCQAILAEKADREAHPKPETP